MPIIDKKSSTKLNKKSKFFNFPQKKKIDYIIIIILNITDQFW
jgi:hypothetical protein